MDSPIVVADMQPKTQLLMFHKHHIRIFNDLHKSVSPYQCYIFGEHLKLIPPLLVAQMGLIH